MKYNEIYLRDRFPFLGENGRNPKVSLYLPAPLTEIGRDDWKRPCMVICPGGGYCMCSQMEAEPIGLHFLKEGYNVFILWYSIAPHRFPNQLREVAALMEMIHENADTWHCDTKRIAILGFSAGGHLAAHYSTCYDIAEVRAVFPESKPVQASVLCYPVISADPAIAHMGTFQNLLGVNHLSKEQEEAFSCDLRVTQKTPPAFLWHTAEDNVAPVANSLRYAEALSRYQIPFAMRVYPYGWHGLATVDDVTNNTLPENIRIAANWLPDVIQWLRITFQ